jgi:hypothetical protein
MIRATLTLIAAILGLLALAPAAHAQSEAPAAAAQATLACADIVEAQATAPAVRAAVAKAGLTRETTVPQLMQDFFFKGVAQVDWWRRPVNGGAVRVGIDPAAPSCVVFVEGQPGKPSFTALVASLAGWSEEPAEDGSTSYYRARADGSLLVISLTPGSDAPQPSQIGAMFRVWIVK